MGENRRQKKAKSTQKEGSMVYTISFFIAKYLIQILFSAEGRGQRNFPKKGPFIAVFNHNSYLDILTMSLVVNFPVHGMAKAELFKVPVLGWWLRKIGVHSILRDSGDEEGFRYFLEVLRNRARLFISPEGTRKWKEGKPPRPKTGFVRLAQLTRCPVVPVGISSTRDILPPGSTFPRFKKVIVQVGKPINLPPVEVTLENKEVLQEQANMVMNEVYKLVLKPPKKIKL